MASFSEPPPERRTEGMSPLEAADELVYELRKFKGIPAYTYSQDDQVARLETIDRLGRKSNRSYTSNQGSVSVIAGNYQSIDKKTRKGRDAQTTLKIVQKFYPRFLQEVRATSKGILKLSNGGLYRKTPGRPGPLSRAFLTMNPLLTPEEVRQAKSDPLLLALNSDSQLSLLNNRGKHSLVVASFYGNSVTKVGNAGFKQALKNFKVGNSLDKAGRDAWELAKMLRDAKKHGYDQSYEAYVYHDRYSSVVTIGSFDNPNDPRIAMLQKKFGAKTKPYGPSGQNVLLGEYFTIPRVPKSGSLPKKKWLFDPQPKLMEVPQIR
ncbi:MAG: hypothetical protein IID46_00855 [Planctomycetes bacterium]|nr:hypothetical protein [Planctomycetota bacterium]